MDLLAALFIASVKIVKLSRRLPVMSGEVKTSLYRSQLSLRVFHLELLFTHIEYWNVVSVLESGLNGGVRQI